MMRQLLIWLTLLPAAAQAQVPEMPPTLLGNLPEGFYPAPPCPKPVLEEDKGEHELTNAQRGLTQLAIDSYHRRVEKYNRGVSAYNVCAKSYVEKSRYDIDRIVSTVNASIAETQDFGVPSQPPFGNLPPDFYPRSPCTRPDRAAIGAQPAITDIKAMEAYNLKVATYNQQAVTFGACVKDYQERARHDIQRIQATVQSAAVNPVSSRDPKAAVASVQSGPTPEPGPAATEVESVVVTGSSSKAVNRFVQTAAAPTHITGKVARWEVPICPAALGLPPDETARVVHRLKDLAVQAGVPVSSNAGCKPNIHIAFTSTPQEFIDSIRKDQREWLGYHSSSDELDRLSIVTRPIQAWYSTATIDLQGHREVDSSRTDKGGRGLVVTGPCGLVGGGGGRAAPGGGKIWDSVCTVVLPNAAGVTVTGSRLTDGLRSTFDHVMIIANPPAVGSGMATIDDYISVLALTQINSLDTCQVLPSITSLLRAAVHRLLRQLRPMIWRI